MTVNEALLVEVDNPPDDPGAAYAAVLAPLFESAAKTAAFDLVCTLLRVGGYEMADWDSFEESRTAFSDYNWLLERAHGRGDTSARRVGLLMYCQAVEMNAVHEILVEPSPLQSRKCLLSCAIAPSGTF